MLHKDPGVLLGVAILATCVTFAFCWVIYEKRRRRYGKNHVVE